MNEGREGCNAGGEAREARVKILNLGCGALLEDAHLPHFSSEKRHNLKLHFVWSLTVSTYVYAGDCWSHKK